MLVVELVPDPLDPVADVDPIMTIVGRSLVDEDGVEAILDAVVFCI